MKLKTAEHYHSRLMEKTKRTFGQPNDLPKATQLTGRAGTQTQVRQTVLSLLKVWSPEKQTDTTRSLLEMQGPTQASAFNKVLGDPGRRKKGQHSSEL